MKGSARGVSVAFVRPMAELLSRLDVDPVPFLATLGVDGESAPETFVPGELVDRLLQNIADHRGDPVFGLTLASAAVIKPLGLFSHLVWVSGTVRDAIVRAARFYAMVSRRTKITLEEHGKVAVLRQHRVPSVARGAILTEFVFASFSLRARAATEQRFSLRAARFAHASEHGAHPAYAKVFAAPVTFDSAVDELELDASQLDLHLASADAFTADALEARAAVLAAVPSGQSALVDRVKRAVSAELTGQPSLQGVGRQLGMSARTLRRHLEQEGTSLRAVLDDVRRERADTLLAAGTSVKEIAFALGFSEPSAFSRAYKRWTGRPPKTG